MTGKTEYVALCKMCPSLTIIWWWAHLTVSQVHFPWFKLNNNIFCHRFDHHILWSWTGRRNNSYFPLLLPSTVEWINTKYVATMWCFKSDQIFCFGTHLNPPRSFFPNIFTANNINYIYIVFVEVDVLCFSIFWELLALELFHSTCHCRQVFQEGCVGFSQVSIG